MANESWWIPILFGWFLELPKCSPIFDLYIFVYVEMLQIIEEYGNIIKETVISLLSHHLGNPQFPKWLTLPGIKIVDLLLSLFSNIWWVQNNWFLRAFSKNLSMVEAWKVLDIWKSLKIKTQLNLIKPTSFRESADNVWLIVDRRAIWYFW